MKSQFNDPTAPNEEETERIVTIKIMDILFNDKVASLVYMQDLTKFVKENETIQQTEKLLKASKCISERIKMPQQTLIMLTKQLIDSCAEEQRETLQAIEYGTRMVQLLVQDLTDLQKLKYETFELQKTEFCTNNVLEEIVNINKIQAEQSEVTFNIEIDETTPAKVIVDSERVIQILHNMIAKALELSANRTII